MKSPRSIRFTKTVAALAAALFLFVCAASASDIVPTKHNLSSSGPGPIKSGSEDRICIFCHTPHNATPGTPLWNKDVQPQTYSVYTSPTLKAGSLQPLPQPTGPTKLCLTCHDGTIALGTVASGANLGIGQALSSPNVSYFGLNLSAHHPVSFDYSTSLPNTELVSPEVLPGEVQLGQDNQLHCTTCHDPHDNSFGKFLVKDNSASQLCESCHVLTGWSVAAHDTCSDCHMPHSSVTAQWLLSFTSYDACLGAGCHAADPGHLKPARSGKRGYTGLKPLSAPRAEPSAAGRVDVKAQISKPSGHRPKVGAVLSSPRDQALRRSAANQVTCVDCHNPHQATVRKADAAAPDVSGMLDGVTGIDRNGVVVAPARYEYEICFKCHSDYNPELQYVPRVVSSTNLRYAFDPENASYHPVVGMGRNLNVPSIPSPIEPGRRSTDVIYCTDCHRDDNGASRGPHGSSYAPILRERYDTMDGAPETYERYALCYRCHNRSSILSDSSFRRTLTKTGSRGGHSGHLSAGIACAACHDPHGVPTMFLASPEMGQFTHLMNFDTRIVLPKPGASRPVFSDKGLFSGSCTLLCHGKLHDGLSYP